MLYFINASLSFISIKESLGLFNWKSIARISFVTLVTCLQTISMCVETAIAEYTLTFSLPVGVAVVLEAVLGVPGISEGVRGAAAERVPLRLRILLRVGVLGGGEVSRGGMVWV